MTFSDMSTEMMTKDGQFIIIPRRAWGKVPTWSAPAEVKGSEPSFVDIMNEQLREKVEVGHIFFYFETV